tara:strand:+ start:512 stop:1570 length:1059 start_codon:yes stop_codon:yes gene_type:complete
MSSTAQAITMRDYFRLDFSAMIITAGAGQTGKTVNCVIRRRNDGLFYDNAGAFGAGVTVIAMTEEDSTNLAGLYTYQADLTETLAELNLNADGFDVKIEETTTSYLDYVLMQPRSVPYDLLNWRWGDQWFGTNYPTGETTKTLAGWLWTLMQANLHVGDYTTPLPMFVTATPGTTTKFYMAVSGPVTADSAQYAGSVAVFYDVSTDIQYPCRIVAIANDGADYFSLTQLDGTALAAAPASGDFLIALARNEAPTSADVVDGIFEASMAAYSTSGSFGDDFNRMLRLRQSNHRIINTAFDVSGQATVGYLLTYDSKADADADTDPWALATGRYDFTASYTDGLMDDYKSVKTS